MPHAHDGPAKPKRVALDPQETQALRRLLDDAELQALVGARLAQLGARVPIGDTIVALPELAEPKTVAELARALVRIGLAAVDEDFVGAKIDRTVASSKALIEEPSFSKLADLATHIVDVGLAKVQRAAP